MILVKKSIIYSLKEGLLMIVILSPAKTYKEEGVIRHKLSNNLPFELKTKALVTQLQTYSVAELCSLMKMSEALGVLNQARFDAFYDGAEVALEGIHAFDGEAFKGLDSLSLSSSAIAYATDHLRVLSGLYGVIRPTDYINPYRLEMGTKLETAQGKDLYAFWKSTLTDYLLGELSQTDGEQVLVNLASKEYSKALDLKQIDTQYPVITIEFKEQKGEAYKVVGMYAKRARGEMVRFILENQIQKQENLKLFNSGGYMYNEALSTEKSWIFTR